jgi:hypothetical protein
MTALPPTEPIRDVHYPPFGECHLSTPQATSLKTMIVAALWIVAVAILALLAS